MLGAKSKYEYYYQPYEGPGSGTDGTFQSSYFPTVYEKANEITVPSGEEIKANEQNYNGPVLQLSSYNFEAFRGIFKSNGEQVSSSTTLINPQIGELYSAKYFYGVSTYSLTLTYTFTVLNNLLPRKRLTVTDVIIRLCDLIEPLTYGQQPRFQFDGVTYNATTGRANASYAAGSQGALLNAKMSPEFSFTKETFREQLQEIGGFIHGEPRITSIERAGSSIRNKVRGGYIYHFKFDFYGDETPSYIQNRPKVTKIIDTSVNEWHTALDSSVENLTNTRDDNSATYSPSIDMSISLRAETAYMRVAEDNNTFIPTAEPIIKIKELLLHRVPTGGSQANPTFTTVNKDISGYVVEKTEYDNLSSYDEVYPYSKTFAIYYTQGEKNIYGLFFRQEAATDSYFRKNYAILNIIKAVSNIQNIPPELYPYIEFKVVYQSIHGERVITAKPFITGGRPRALALNQSANGVETQAFGEHLKGLSLKAGNVEKTETYLLSWLSDIPKAGTKYDDNYWISQVKTEFKPTYMLCTVGLSKNFNMKSNYIGLDSIKRMWEVSERQIQNRQTVFNTYLVAYVDDREPSNVAESVYGVKGYGTVDEMFFNYNWTWASSDDILQGISMFINGRDIDGNLLHSDYTIALPTEAAAYGNTVIVSAKFKDNFSAGQKTQYNSSGGVAGVWTNDVAYADAYGQMYYADIWLGILGENETYAPSLLPQVPHKNKPAINNQPHYPQIEDATVRKDSREVLGFAFALHCVSADERLIIGSAFVRNCRLVNKNPSNVRFYLLTKKISSVSDKITNSSSDFNGVTYPLGGYENYVNLPDVRANGDVYLKKTGTGTVVKMTEVGNVNIVAWAIGTPTTTTTITVAGEDGTTTTQTIVSGGEILIGGNFKPQGQRLQFVYKNDIEGVFPVKTDDSFQ